MDRQVLWDPPDPLDYRVLKVQRVPRARRVQLVRRETPECWEPLVLLAHQER